MSRIKKRGLDYFPMNTDFIHDRLVRRILKREGDAALAVLLQTYCCIYSGEGYYVLADRLFYDDMADCLYQQEAADAERIINLAIECGIFDATLFEKYHILTSADIQSQFLFITKRRNANEIDARYNLLPPEEATADTSAQKSKEEKDNRKASKGNDIFNETDAKENADENTKHAGGNNENIDSTNKNETFRTKNNENAYQSTQSIEKQSIVKESKVKQSIENPLLNSSPETGGTDCAAPKAAKEEEKEGKEEKEKKEKEQEMKDMKNMQNMEDMQPAKTSPAQTRKTPHEWTDEDITRLTPPQDGLRRNLDGLVFNLRQLHIPLNEQYAIILKSNFGIIGHPMWEGFYTLRNCHGKIRQPGRYLLSLCKPASAKA